MSHAGLDMTMRLLSSLCFEKDARWSFDVFVVAVTGALVNDCRG